MATSSVAAHSGVPFVVVVAILAFSLRPVNNA